MKLFIFVGVIFLLYIFLSMNNNKKSKWRYYSEQYTVLYIMLIAAPHWHGCRENFEWKIRK